MNSRQPTLTCISEFSDFMKLADKWNALVEKSTGKSVFLRHEWFEAAWQWRQHSSELCILTVHQDDVLIGICPLVKTRVLKNKLSLRALEFLTIPDTQFCDIIAAPDEKPLVLEAFSRWLKQTRRSWDTLNLSYLPNTSPTSESLPAILQKAGLQASTSQVEQNPYIELQSNWDEFYKGCSRRLKKGNNLIRNKIQRAGDVRLEQAQTPEEVRNALKVLATLSSQSWKQTTNTTFDNAGPKAFIERLTSLAIQQNWASLWILYLDDKPLAAEYQLIYDGDVFALRSDFDEKAGDLSPGSYLNWQLLERLFGQQFEQQMDQPLKRYYMGPGKNAYKKRWTKISVPIHRVTGYNTSLRGRIIYSIDQYIRPWKQQCSQWLTPNTEKKDSTK
ncbi:MAG: GNAT family N-acetyltransferase [Ectothiorhodospiraceae bacterium]|nr:GNAT family N-acetyltransferase [Ectothiorhodospiraceae bacterium]